MPQKAGYKNTLTTRNSGTNKSITPRVQSGNQNGKVMRGQEAKSSFTVKK